MALREGWRELDGPSVSPQRKGRLLEEVVALLFQTIDGFAAVRRGVANAAEEIDVVVENRSTDPLLAKEGSYLLVECKNWSGKVGPSELAAFQRKIEDRFGRTRLGLLVALGGFTENVSAKLTRSANRPELVLLLDRAALGSWIQASDRARWLADRVAHAAFRTDV